MRLIDAHELIDRIIAKYIRHERNRELMFTVVEIKQDMADIINDIPTVDAVPVVRCKECKYYLHSNEKCELIDTRLHFYETRNRWTDDDFCAWGERKGGDE